MAKEVKKNQGSNKGEGGHYLSKEQMTIGEFHAHLLPSRGQGVLRGEVAFLRVPQMWALMPVSVPSACG